MLTQRMASKTEFFEGLFSADDEVVDDNVDEWALLHQSFHGKPDISDHEAQDPVQTPSLVVHSPDGPVIDQTASERPRTASAKEFKMPKNPPAIPKSEEVPEIEVVPGPKANASFSAKGQPKRQAKRKRTDSVTLAPELGRAFAGKVLCWCLQTTLLRSC